MRRLLALLLCSWLVPSPASANIGEGFGFGARWASLAGAGAAGGMNSFAAYYNPAGLAAPTSSRLQLTYGVSYGQPTFKGISGVVKENAFNSDAVSGSPRLGTIDTSYREVFGQAIGLSYQLLPELRNLSLGVVTYIPMTAVAYMDTGETYLPEYFLYRARMQRPQVDFGLGAKLGGGLHAGLGAHLGYSMASTADVYLTSNAGKPSTMRFSASLTPRIGPYAGIYFEPEQGSFSAGAVFRLPVASDATLALRTGANALGFLPALYFNFSAASALYYDPMAAELGFKWDYASWGKLVGQVEYQFWSAFRPPFLLIANNPVAAGVAVSPGIDPGFQFNNIPVARLGHELQINERSLLRFAYAFKPTIVKGDNSGVGNYLDPAKHLFQAGFGRKFHGLLGKELDWNLDVSLAYHLLVGPHVTKTSGNELGDAADSKVGAPGYDIGGAVLMGGVSLSLLL